MTWSSASARAVALTAAVLAAGCTAERIEETQAIVIAQTDACEDMVSRRVLVNNYRILVFQFTPGPRDPDLPPCVDCVRSGDCPLLFDSCSCGRPSVTSTVPLNNALQDFRIEDLDPDLRYCMAFVAYAQDPPMPCACESLRTVSSRVCGISLFPAEVGQNASAILIPAECRAGCANVL